MRGMAWHRLRLRLFDHDLCDHERTQSLEHFGTCRRGSKGFVMAKFFKDVRGKQCVPVGSVVCLGAFDGLHLGHQALVQQTIARARARGLTPTAVCFEPLPREYFNRSAPPPRVSGLRDRVALLCAAGVEIVCVLHFTARLSSLTAETFVLELLVRRLKAREVWIGPGFRFGHCRRGDLCLLQRLGNHYCFDADAIAPVEQGGHIISSTRIRHLLSQGRLDDAARLLGRRYAISGRVVRGRQLGRTLGYPTANLRFKSLPALTGVYAAWVHSITAAPLRAVVNVGMRPTVAGREPLVEVHLFDYQADIYGRLMRVEFAAKLRDERKFTNLAELVNQMRQDASIARQMLETVSP